ncbi:hypothetical protein ACNOYE_02600 [Nannocystaceae bacterium ST9]
MARGILPSDIASLSLTGALVLACSTLGCGPGGGVDDEAEAEGGSETETDTGGQTDELGPLALGIDIVEVEANQGTAVLIGQAGEWVGAEGRNAYMIRDRDTLIRLQHTVQPGWVPREIVGVLHLRTAEGVELEPRTRKVMIEADSDPKNLNTEFYFSIVADEAKVGLSYWVELRETSPEFDAGEATQGVVVTPPDYAEIGYEQTTLEMKVMLVPIEYTYIDPPTTAIVTESDLQLVADDLLQENPLQKVTLQVHEPHVYSQQITNLGQLLSPMMALRSDDGAEANLYYHALVDVRGPSVNMVAGIAQLAGDDKSSAVSRVAATVWYKPGEQMSPGGSSGTIVHEVGHNQGFSHVYCSAASTPAAGPDPNYPHDDGKIGVFGFGIRNFRLFTPTAAHDYMTYCGNAWVSDWTWNKAYNRIRTLTSWDYEGTAGDDPHTQPLLVGTLFEDGSEQWWAMLGPAPSAEQRSSEQRIHVIGEGGELLDVQYPAVSLLSDGATQMIIAPLDVPLDRLDALERVDWRGEAHAIDPTKLTLGSGVEFDRAINP